MANTYFTSSSAFSLSTSYEYYSFEYVVPQNTTSVQVQVLMGEDVGIYYLDTFDVSVEDYTLGVNFNILTSELSISPNPVEEKLNLKTNNKILWVNIYDMLGHVILSKKRTHLIDVSHLSKGVYLAKIKLENGATQTKKFVKN